MGECLIGTNIFYGVGKGVHMVKDCPYLRIQGRGNGQAQPSGTSFEAQKRNRFYALKVRGEHGKSPHIVTGMLQVFFVNVYAFLDLGDTLSLVTPLVARKFDILPDVLIEPFLVCNPMCDSVVAKRVYRKCLVMIPK